MRIFDNNRDFLDSKTHILAGFAGKCPEVDTGAYFVGVHHAVVHQGGEDLLHRHGGDPLLLLTLFLQLLQLKEVFL